MAVPNDYDLGDIAVGLSERFSEIKKLYLFGSRMHKTKSPRSDVDILVVVGDDYIRPVELREYAQELCPALDPFLVREGEAISCANESRIAAQSLEGLCEKLGAILFWTKDTGRIDVEIDWTFQLLPGLDFPPTVAMPPDVTGPVLKAIFAEADKREIPTTPFLGRTVDEVANFLIELVHRLPTAAARVNKKKRGLPQLDLRDEYCFQDLFQLIVLPWIPNLEREPFTIKYDDQKKFADFSLCGGRIVVEMKHVSDSSSKSGIIKTLAGLKEFYIRNPNVEVLLFVISVADGVEIDGPKWETDYSHPHGKTRVHTTVVKG